MATFTTPEPDQRSSQMSFGLLLSDAFTQSCQLAGRTTVSLLGRRDSPIEKSSEGAFIFLNLAPGAYTVQVRSNESGLAGNRTAARPFYLDLDLPINLPLGTPLWPAYPDLALANQNLPLDDPAQPAAYRAQRQNAALKPTTWYPFPEGATLVRGTVRFGNVALAGATVRTESGGQSYLTGPEGEFVLFFNQVEGTSEDIVLEATHPLHPLTDTDVTLQRGRTAVCDITMP
jgi:hypothetical protein